MTYCCRRVSSTGSKPLISRVSSPLNWQIGNSFAYKLADLIADKATRCAPSWFDPTLTHVNLLGYQSGNPQRRPASCRVRKPRRSITN
jgi:hypothetical protein